VAWLARAQSSVTVTAARAQQRRSLNAAVYCRSHKGEPQAEGAARGSTVVPLRGDRGCAAAQVANHRWYKSFQPEGKTLPKTGDFFPFTDASQLSAPFDFKGRSKRFIAGIAALFPVCWNGRCEQSDTDSDGWSAQALDSSRKSVGTDGKADHAVSSPIPHTC
jgi:hypothetical protein